MTMTMGKNEAAVTPGAELAELLTEMWGLAQLLPAIVPQHSHPRTAQERLKEEAEVEATFDNMPV